ncbi:hypothetical protein Pcinc_010751 [Petrolisthes cinctipes]|uniref:Uncharacterized protein n=1 Tax=Petrolisthes cinctipes TaxID=88211 RepID=A0AAE1KX35_PETCI|nr:hypothetical protein Pcinc_010751 [Petrolisthes cinctipes]
MEGRTAGVRFGEGRKLNEPIRISVKLNSGINTSSCVKIVGDILKYILYQRQQIPVQFDVLAREVAKETSCGDDDEHSNIPEDQTTTIHNRKEERKKRLFNTKRKRWLIKVKHLLESFRNVIEVLRHEFEGGQVKAVNLVLGGSVLTSREVYSIILPDHYTNNTQLNGHHSLIQLFRELVVHEELVNIMSRRCRVQRVWVMILKLKCPTNLPSPCLASTASQMVTSSPQDVCSPSSLLILRPEYTPSIRARVVQINIQHPLSHDIAMELTPSVGAGITHIGATHSCGKNGSKRNLCIELSAADKHHQPKDVRYERDCGSSQYPMDDGSDRFESYVQSVSFSSNREQKQAKLCQYETPYICKHKLKVQRAYNVPSGMCVLNSTLCCYLLAS